MTRIALLVLIFTALLIPASAQTDTQTPPDAVFGVFFYSDTCPHCHTVMDEHLPGMFDTFGDQFQLILLEVHEQDNQQIMAATCQQVNVPLDRCGSVPLMVIGSEWMLGSVEIPERAPGLIESGIASGGVPLPAVDRLTSAYEAAIGGDPGPGVAVMPAQDDAPVSTGQGAFTQQIVAGTLTVDTLSMEGVPAITPAVVTQDGELFYTLFRTLDLEIGWVSIPEVNDTGESYFAVATLLTPEYEITLTVSPLGGYLPELPVMTYTVDEIINVVDLTNPDNANPRLPERYEFNDGALFITVDEAFATQLAEGLDAFRGQLRGGNTTPICVSPFC